MYMKLISLLISKSTRAIVIEYKYCNVEYQRINSFLL